MADKTKAAAASVFDHRNAHNNPNDKRLVLRNILLPFDMDNDIQPQQEEEIISMSSKTSQHKKAFHIKYQFPYDSSVVSYKKKKDVVIVVYPLARIVCGRPSLPLVQAVYEANPDAISDVDESTRIPLHYACRYCASYDVIDFLITLYPEGVRVRTNFNMLPLQYAVANHTDVAVIKRLIESYPESMTLFANRNMHPPLSYACFRQKSNLDIIRFLIDTYPAGLEERSVDGSYPLHYACIRQDDDEDVTPTIQLVQLLLDRFPDAVRRRNREYRYPLHKACEKKKHTKTQFDVVRLLVRHFPEAVTAVDGQGLFPYQLAAASAGSSSSSSSSPRVVTFLYALKEEWETLAAAPNEQERQKILDRIEGESDSSPPRLVVPNNGIGTEEDNKHEYFNHMEAKYADHRIHFREELMREQLDEAIILELLDKSPKFAKYIYDGRPRKKNSSKTSSNTTGGKMLMLSPNYALGLVCPKNPSLELVETMYNIHPEAIGYKEKDTGRYPLHLACRTAASDEVIYFLLDAFPDAVERATVRGQFPIHLACLNGVSLDVIKVMLSMFPQSAQLTTTNLLLSLHCACQCDSAQGLVKLFLSIDSTHAMLQAKNGYYALHYACVNSRPLEDIQRLVSAYPECLRIRVTPGELPLHLACRSSYRDNVIRFLLEMYPEGATVSLGSSYKRTPSLLAKKSKKLSTDTIALLNFVADKVEDFVPLTPDERRMRIDAFLENGSTNDPNQGFSSTLNSDPTSGQVEDASLEERMRTRLERKINNEQNAEASITTTPTEMGESVESRETIVNDATQISESLTCEVQRKETLTVALQGDDSEGLPGAHPISGPRVSTSPSSVSSNNDSDEAEERPLFGSHSNTLLQNAPIAAQVAPEVADLEAQLEILQSRLSSERVVQADLIKEPKCCTIL